MRSVMIGVICMVWLVAALGLTAAPPKGVEREGRVIDLSPYYTTRFDAPGYDKAGRQLPSVRPVFDGLRFDLRGQVTLWGRTMSERRQYDYPASVRGIRVDARFDELHLCHHARWTDAVGRTIGWVRLNYDDGSRHEFSIVFGRHVRDWFFLPSYEDETVDDPEAKVIWRDPEGDNNSLRGFRRLWKTRFMNPHPGRMVSTMDFESAHGFAHYSVIAATVAVRDESREKTPSIPFDQPKRHFTGRIRIAVLDAVTGRPLPNVVVDPGTITRGANVVAEMLMTDAGGRATFRYWKEETTQVYVRVRAEGYEPANRLWRGVIDEAVEFRLQPGTSVGGIVVDGEARPVEGASVVLGMRAACTDREGRWSLSGLSPLHDGQRLEVGHPDYATVRLAVGTDLKAAVLDRRAAVLTLDGGYALTGRVTDGSGKPVTGASVEFGASGGSALRQETYTDSEGDFEIKRVARGRGHVRASAPGLASALAEVNVGEGQAPVTLVLKPANVVRGRVEDESGRPLAGVRVYGRRLPTPHLSEFRVTTGTDGRFQWETAPDERVTLMFTGEGLNQQSVTVPSGRQEELVVTLNAVRTVKGRVEDAVTGAPVPRFNVRVGNTYGGGNLSLTGTGEGRDGRFEVKLDRLSSSVDGVVVVEADGYVPALSAGFPVKSPPTELRFQLQQGEALKGIVLQPDGRPAVGARVALKGRGSQFNLRDGVLSAYGMARLEPAGADQAGRFLAPLQPEPERIVAAHATGYAELAFADFKQGDTIRLQPWGRLTGTLTENGKPMPNEAVYLSRGLVNGVAVHLQFTGFPIRTDSNGSVSFPLVPPGEHRFVWMIETRVGGGRSWAHVNERAVRVKPGGTTMVNLDVGLRLRAVTGRIRTPGWEGGDGEVEIELRGHTAVNPAGRKIDGEPARERSLAERGYVNPRFRLEPDREGRFQIQDVPAGRYTLFAKLQGEPIAGTAHRQQLGHVAVVVEVPAGSGEAGTPFDLGDHEILLQLKEGDTAPPIEAGTLDGRPFRLEDLRGRFVLLDFWATWCGPCLQETPHLKGVHDEFGTDERFALVGLSLDHSIVEPKRYVAGKGLGWLNVHLDASISQSVTRAYRIRGIPQIVLIDPEGKIVAMGLRGDRIREAVARVLREGQ